MSLYSELLESYALQIVALREGRNLLMKRKMRPNMVNMKTSGHSFVRAWSEGSSFEAEDRCVQKTPKAVG